MKFVATVAAVAGLVAAQRPTNTSICDYYTGALLMSNTAENQYTLLKLLVNTVVIGNYTKSPAPMNAVPGILAPGTVNGTEVNLAPYFTGALMSSNRNGMPTSVNFLDGGAAAPLMNNTLPTEGSNQYTLVTHLYQYFGYLLGCTMQGQSAFPSYGGSTSQYRVHRYMNLTLAQNTYFINQVALAAASFGVASSDITAVGTALNSLFNVRCGPATAVPMTADAALQSICTADDCPLAANADCAAYAVSGVSSASGSARPSGSSGAGGAGAGASTRAASGTARATSSGSRAASGTGAARTSGAASAANVVVSTNFLYAGLVGALGVVGAFAL
ncbi:hypothetical protein BCR37DRAFT_18283 [Protomyces lactucae-debilis]|uniref:Heme haloperoxidase family profile domain-containing protein n=1 Tax=Protomyces lactucae-debilis TaxID=2754530 RepID=A0A1Y2FVC0_PROLT|nr:uncharacterized protein BCR37DRAFT_18283 [Protomyces lactucae-debilis]ORY87963.1 hypothetical protein BCR37DRAFT_18283 [Protomyces lactucae-debilis]